MDMGRPSNYTTLVVHEPTAPYYYYRHILHIQLNNMLLFHIFPLFCESVGGVAVHKTLISVHSVPEQNEKNFYLLSSLAGSPASSFQQNGLH